VRTVCKSALCGPHVWIDAACISNGSRRWAHTAPSSSRRASLTKPIKPDRELIPSNRRFKAILGAKLPLPSSMMRQRRRPTSMVSGPAVATVPTIPSMASGPPSGSGDGAQLPWPSSNDAVHDPGVILPKMSFLATEHPTSVSIEKGPKIMRRSNSNTTRRMGSRQTRDHDDLFTNAGQQPDSSAGRNHGSCSARRWTRACCWDRM
jgi:hypothetical protein